MIDMTDDRSRQYELAVLVTNEAGEVDIDSLLAEFSQSHNLVMDGKDPAKLVALSYPIKKHKSAILLTYRFTASPLVAPLLSQALRHREGVLRNLVITPPIINQSVSLKRGPQEENKPEMFPEVSLPSTSAVPKEAATNEDLAAVLQELSQ
jgi:ribosomal protein S6